MQNLVITDAGRELIAQMLAERTAVTFTRICTSDWEGFEKPDGDAGNPAGGSYIADCKTGFR